MKNCFRSFTLSGLYRKSDSQSSSFLWLAITLIVVAFLTLQPRSLLMSSTVVRQWKLQHFVDQVINNQSFDINQFWQLRDEMGGIIEYNPSALEPYSILHLKKMEASPSLLLTVSGPQFVSKEFLFKGNDLSLISDDMRTEKIIFQNQETVMTLNFSTHQLHIKNIFPFEKMKDYNGVIDNQLLAEDLSDWRWLVETNFTVSPNFKLP
ncbi:MAG: hypothetical protein COY81_02225 [Candidatus Pacebacteria bacterium CG_4_10_14_0_8_um_filter_43_12]|nr:MAG: hypothetical protein COY81_02225 [Candidatus Pacebacteria bacterium CG_4_10_14_0_8_um_filter_43_12]